MQHVDLAYPEPQLAVVTLKGVGRFNLMSYAMLHELWSTANTIQADPNIRVVVITGNVEAFSAGMNLKQEEVRNFEHFSIDERLNIHAIGARACAAWEGLDAVTLCAIEGHCLGGGLAFVVACDYRISSKEAIFWAPELRNGMNMSWQSVPRLVSLVGPSRTRKIVMLADKIDAESAEQWGLVDELVPAGRVLDHALVSAHRFLEMPAAPLRMSKHAISVAANALNHAVSYMDLEQYVACQATDAHSNALKSFFKEN